jgi:hypothetical protein
MIDRTAAIAKLYEWRDRPCFRTQAWEDRGLIQSPDPIPFLLSEAKRTLVDELLKAVFSDSNEKRLTAIILEHLTTGMNGGFDMEEREFLGDCFIQMANSLELSNFDESLDQCTGERAK